MSFCILMSHYSLNGGISANLIGWYWNQQLADRPCMCRVDKVDPLGLRETICYRFTNIKSSGTPLLWASCQIRKCTGCTCAGNAGNVFPPLWVSDPNRHHGTCVTHVAWCMLGSLTSCSLGSRWWRTRSQHSPCMCSRQFYIYGKRPIWVTGI